jgi:Ca2+-dependent lipid-binding protein
MCAWLDFETLVKRGRELLAKDDNGLSDPYCIFKHRLDDLQYVAKTTIKLETLSPEWEEEFTFVIKK